MLGRSSFMLRRFVQFESQIAQTPALSLDPEVLDQLDLKGRNSRVPKKANHGARPCSSVMRRLKK